MGGRARSRGGVDRGVTRRISHRSLPAVGAGTGADPLVTIGDQPRLAPVLHGQFGRNWVAPTSAPEPGESHGVLLLMFPPDGVTRVVGTSNTGNEAGRDVAVLVGGAVISRPARSAHTGIRRIPASWAT